MIDGKTGKPLVKPFVKSSSMANTSPLSVSMQGLGNDLFIYWISDCNGHEGDGTRFEFVEGTNVHEQSRADTCKLRYNAKSFSKLYVTNHNIGFPGEEIYYSGDTMKFLYSNHTEAIIKYFVINPNKHKQLTASVTSSYRKYSGK